MVPTICATMAAPAVPPTHTTKHCILQIVFFIAHFCRTLLNLLQPDHSKKSSTHFTRAVRSCQNDEQEPTLGGTFVRAWEGGCWVGGYFHRQRPSRSIGVCSGCIPIIQVTANSFNDKDSIVDVLRNGPVKKCQNTGRASKYLWLVLYLTAIGSGE